MILGDTHLLSSYFELVQRRHRINKQDGNLLDLTLYMPPIIFDRNAHLVPPLVRVADLMWCGAGLSCFQPHPKRNKVAIPTAIYTVTLPLVDLVGGWDTGPEAIGEDMHMMLKCYFSTNGKLNIESIASPASHCNVSSSTAGLRGWVDGHRARYAQGLRHMWGCLDTGYTIHQWLKLGSKPPLQSLISRRLAYRSLELKLAHSQLHGDQGQRLTWRNMVLLTRIFEAHFLPIHLFIIMLTSTIYANLSAPMVHGQYLSLLLDFTGMLRALGFITMLLYFATCYERYHRICLEVRESELRASGLYEDMQHSISRRSPFHPFTWIDYLAFPVAGSFFGSAPLIQAASSHFWTEKLNYKVSMKPKRFIKEMLHREAEEGRPLVHVPRGLEV